MDPRKLNHQCYYLVEAFEDGIKDVIELKDIEQYAELINYLKSRKYYRKLVRRKGTKNSYYFFKTKELKQEFLDTMLSYVEKNEIHKVSTEYGLMMGYPPKACEYFPLKVYTDEPYVNVFVNYGGMFFASYEETIEEDLKWLLENKPLDEDSFVLVDNELFKTSVPNWDKKLLKSISRFKLKMKIKSKKVV